MAIDNNIKIALIHDWLSKDYKGGAEKVLKEIGEALIKKDLNYDLYTLVNHLDKENFKELNQQKIFTSIIQNLPYSNSKFVKLFNIDASSLGLILNDEIVILEYDVTINQFNVTKTFRNRSILVVLICSGSSS